MTTFTVWKFEDPDGAAHAATALKSAQTDGLVTIVDHAVILFDDWGWREEVRLNRDANSNTLSLSVSLFAQFVENTAIEEIVFLDLGACCIGLAFLFEKYFDAVIVGV